MNSRRDITLTWGKRLAIVLVILCAIVYGVLIIAERNVDAIRQGLQDYLTQASGHRAQVTDLASAEITRGVRFKMNGIYIFDKDDAKKTLVSAENAYFAMPLMNMLLGIPQYEGLEIRNLAFASNFPMPKKIMAEFVGIADPSPDKSPPQFMVEGTYGAETLLVTAELERKVKKTHYLYRFGDNFPFTVKIGALEGGGRFVRGFSSVSLEKFELTHGAMQAALTVRDIKGGEDEVNGRIEGTIDGVPITGTIRRLPGAMAFEFAPAPGHEAEFGRAEKFIRAVERDLALNAGGSKVTFGVKTTGEEQTKE